MMMKLICQINELISVWADDSQYVVRVKTTPKQSIKHASNSYFSSLEMCFEEIFEHLCRSRLADGKDKGFKEIAEIIVMTKREIQTIMQPFVTLRDELRGRHVSAEVGKGSSNPN
jgi:hypothetical protein